MPVPSPAVGPYVCQECRDPRPKVPEEDVPRHPRRDTRERKTTPYPEEMSGTRSPRSVDPSPSEPTGPVRRRIVTDRAGSVCGRPSRRVGGTPTPEPDKLPTPWLQDPPRTVQDRQSFTVRSWTRGGDLHSSHDGVRGPRRKSLSSSHHYTPLQVDLRRCGASCDPVPGPRDVTDCT